MSDPTSRHDNAIDGMRAIAVLAVVIFHVDASLLPGGFSGVDLFFVVSGFVISQSLASRPHDHIGRYLLDFYRRRVLRLLPALLLVLLVTFVLSTLFIPRGGGSSDQYDQTGLAAILGISNLVLAWQVEDYFSWGASLNPYLHSWSLGVEEQFYLLFPLLFLIWLRASPSQAWVRWLLPALAVGSMAFAAWQAAAAPDQAFYLLPARFWELAAGAVLFQCIASRTPSPCWQAWAVPGLVLVVVGFAFESNLQFPFPGAIATVIGTVMLLAACTAASGQQRKSPVLQVLGSRPLAYVGRLSYSLYLWHWPLLVLLRWTYGLQGAALWAYPVVLFALASASYHWVERPIRNAAAARRARSPILLGTALAAVVASLGIAWAMPHFNEQLSLSRTRDSYVWRTYLHPAWMQVEPIDAPSLHGRKLFVTGDSLSTSFRPMTSIAARQFGMQLIILDVPGCSFSNLMRADPRGCAPARDNALARIEREARPGDIVLLSSLRMQELRGLDWSRGEAQVFQELAMRRTSMDAAGAARDADAILARLQALQVHVIISAPMPVFKSDPFRCSDVFNRMNPACKAGLTVPRAAMEAMRGPQMALLHDLVERYPLLQVWDPLPLLCPEDRCAAMDGTTPLFFDREHLSGHGNRLLLPDFDRLMLEIADAPVEAPPPPM
ncbi:acyltransferase family protein [Stenotrophomonas pennii]|uniref:acyltransferase family protein n=1 Tax=Stenotrophomonas lacuserhaii TaxID=2760084 RepID=UPI003208714A